MLKEGIVKHFHQFIIFYVVVQLLVSGCAPIDMIDHQEQIEYEYFKEINAWLPVTINSSTGKKEVQLGWVLRKSYFKSIPEFSRNEVQEIVSRNKEIRQKQFDKWNRNKYYIIPLQIIFFPITFLVYIAQMDGGGSNLYSAHYFVKNANAKVKFIVNDEEGNTLNEIFVYPRGKTDYNSVSDTLPGQFDNCNRFNTQHMETNLVLLKSMLLSWDLQCSSTPIEYRSDAGEFVHKVTKLSDYTTIDISGKVYWNHPTDSLDLSYSIWSPGYYPSHEIIRVRVDSTVSVNVVMKRDPDFPKCVEFKKKIQEIRSIINSLAFKATDVPEFAGVDNDIKRSAAILKSIINDIDMPKYCRYNSLQVYDQLLQLKGNYLSKHEYERMKSFYNRKKLLFKYKDKLYPHEIYFDSELVDEVNDYGYGIDYHGWKYHKFDLENLHRLRDNYLKIDKNSRNLMQINYYIAVKENRPDDAEKYASYLSSREFFKQFYPDYILLDHHY